MWGVRKTNVRVRVWIYVCLLFPEFSSFPSFSSFREWLGLGVRGQKRLTRPLERHRLARSQRRGNLGRTCSLPPLLRTCPEHALREAPGSCKLGAWSRGLPVAWVIHSPST